jgi:hypothetical protein
MRTLRLAIVGAASLVLAGSLGAAAQSEADEGVHVTPVTGTVIDSVWDDSQMEFTTEDGVNYGRGMLITETYEWSDPRLPAVKHSVMNFNSYAGEGDGRGIMGQTSTRLEDSVGAWTGGAVTMQYVDGRGVGWDTYFGEGAYEGLVAVLQCTSEGCEGQIFQGERPPMPDPVEPSAE